MGQLIPFSHSNNELPPPPAGKKWHRTAILVDEDDIALEDVYDPRIPKNFQEEYVHLLHIYRGPKRDFAKRVRTDLAQLLEQHGSRIRLQNFGLAEINDESASKPVVFAIIVWKDNMTKWPSIHDLVSDFVKQTISKEEATWLSSDSCPQSQVPIRYYYTDNIGGAPLSP